MGFDADEGSKLQVIYRLCNPARGGKNLSITLDEIRWLQNSDRAACRSGPGLWVVTCPSSAAVAALKNQSG
ncbi:unnamed protein product [Tetraodon nigroviridis]|uniref:(spotted green pufferfish) hypothetical protein n=1 Tax=Tetraodon nigroviridis TaxID=99883 RepID=Q4STZ6_TETNG|nr:unnamed protein product [Tetraodon nigroviridis]